MMVHEQPVTGIEDEVHEGQKVKWKYHSHTDIPTCNKIVKIQHLTVQIILDDHLHIRIYHSHHSCPVWF
jgi:hypothetical protein